jgi:hypothetical protein
MPKVPYPYEVNGKLVTGNTNLFLIKPFLIAKFDCMKILTNFLLLNPSWLTKISKVVVHSVLIASLLVYRRPIASLLVYRRLWKDLVKISSRKL